LLDLFGADWRPKDTILVKLLRLLSQKLQALGLLRKVCDSRSSLGEEPLDLLLHVPAMRFSRRLPLS